MKVISIEDYIPGMGELISLEDPSTFHSIKGSINMSMTKILDNPRKYLDKNKKYYFYCTNGVLSRRIVQILSIYGYDVTKVII